MKFALGLIAGGGLVFLYFRYAHTATQLGRQLLTETEGDAVKAINYVREYSGQALALGKELINRAKGSLDAAWEHVRKLV